MSKVPFTEKQAQSLVTNGHLTPDTFQYIKKLGGFTQGFDEGGFTAPETPAAPVEEMPWTQNAEPAIGRTVMNPTDAPFTMDGLASDMGPNINAQAPGLQGATVASNDPNSDKMISSDLLKQAAARAPAATTPMGPAPAPKPEAGHMPLSELGTIPKQESPPIKGQDFMSKIDAGMADTRKGTADLYKAKENAAQQGSEFMRGMSQQMQRDNSVEKIHEMERQDAVKSSMEQINKLNDDVSTQKVDPNHFWADRTTGQKVMAAIGIALGGIAGGLSGRGGNAALDIINKAIDRDIEIQKANITQGNQRVQNKMGIFNIARQSFQDERQAHLAARSMGLQFAEMKLKQLSMQSEVPEFKAQAMILDGQIATEQTKLHQEMAMNVYKMKNMMQMQGGGAGEVNTEFVDKDVRERFARGVGLAKDPETRREVEKFKTNDDSFKKDLTELKDFAKKHRGTTMDRETVAKGKAMAAALQNTYRTMEAMGVYKEGEAKFMEGIVGSDPTTFYNYIPQLEALENVAKNKRNSFYNARIDRFQPVEEGAPRGSR